MQDLNQLGENISDKYNIIAVALDRIRLENKQLKLPNSSNIPNYSIFGNVGTYDWKLGLTYTIMHGLGHNAGIPHDRIIGINIMLDGNDIYQILNNSYSKNRDWGIKTILNMESKEYNNTVNSHFLNKWFQGAFFNDVKCFD